VRVLPEKLLIAFSLGRLDVPAALLKKASRNMKLSQIIKLAVFCYLALCSVTISVRADWTDAEIADAIFKAEGGTKTKHPYGILAKYKHTTPRQACLNTIRGHKKRHSDHNCGKDFISCLAQRYCPVGAANDPQNLNVNWKRNVLYFLNKGKVQK
jgi:hypothetical protein